MDQFLSTLKKPAALLTVILLLVAAGCTLLVGVGNFDDALFPVIGDLLLLIIRLTLIAAVAVFLLMKKEDLAKKALAPIFAWWIISAVMSGISDSTFIASRYDGLFVAVCVFGFLAGLVLLGAAVMFVLGVFGKTALYKWGWLLFAAAECISFIVMIMTFVYVGVNDFGWSSFVNALGDFTLSLGLFFAGLTMWYQPAKTAEPKALPAGDEKPEATDAPAEKEDSKTE